MRENAAVGFFAVEADFKFGVLNAVSFLIVFTENHQVSKSNIASFDTHLYLSDLGKRPDMGLTRNGLPQFVSISSNCPERET